MSENTYAEIVISGKTYKIAGNPDEAYLQEVADYINQKIEAMTASTDYSRMNTDQRTLMLYLNVADDYFKQKQKIAELEAKVEELERTNYDLTHDLVLSQIRKEQSEDA